MRTLYRASAFFGAACVALGVTAVIAQVLALGACTTTSTTATPAAGTPGATSSQEAQAQQQARADKAKPQPKGY